MRLIHWCDRLREPGISGMKNTVMELVEAELELGIDAGLCDPSFPEGGAEVSLRRRKVNIKPWTWATDRDSVSMLSSRMPKIFYDLPHTVFIAHGMPEYVFQAKENLVTAALNYPIFCDATVCWSKREAEFWKALALDREVRVEYVERGVDLTYWKPEGDKYDFEFHPQIGFLEVPRGVKSPLSWLFALRYAQERVKTLRGQWGAIDEAEKLTWMMLLTKLNLDAIIESFIVGVHPEVWKIYRGIDILFCPIVGGHISRVGVEALACGSSVIILEGSDEKVASAKCRDSPMSISDAIVSLWDKIREDPKKAREDARGIAEKHYDMKDTAKFFVKLAEELI